jgi:predicted RNA-binding Zn ribbon-like protein
MAQMPELVGGALCLDFVNTVDPRHAQNRFDYLPDYGTLVGWAVHAGAISRAEAKRLLLAAKGRPALAWEALRRGLRLREALYELFAAGIGDRRPSSRALGAFNRELQATLGVARLVPRDGQFLLAPAVDGRKLDQVLWPVVDSAIKLLTGAQLDRVRECPGPGNCGWLFLDLSRNATRRWCDMRTCGNRVKAHRHYQQLRARRAV